MHRLYEFPFEHCAEIFKMPTDEKYKKRGILATNAPTFPAPTRGNMNVVPEDLLCDCPYKNCKHPVPLTGEQLAAAAVYPPGVAKQFALAMQQAEVLPIKDPKTYEDLLWNFDQLYEEKYGRVDRDEFEAYGPQPPPAPTGE